MLGQIAGDALGSMVEFQTSEQIRERYPAGPGVIEGSSLFRTLPGQPTDDSELAILLARAILSAGRYDQEAAANAYAWWYRSGPFDIGRATSRALSAGAAAPAGSAARACQNAADADTQANGALMRVSPLGIHCWNKEEGEIARLARLDCRLTHPNEICQDSNAIFVLAVARAVRR